MIIAVGYELQEFDPARINPAADKKIIHIHRFPAEVDMHYPVAVGIIGDISASLNALTDALAGHRFDDDDTGPGRDCSPTNSRGGNRIRGSRSLHSV